MELVAGDFDHHEAQIGIEPFRHHRRWLDVTGPQLAGVAENEVGDPILRRKPFVKMFMSGKDHLDTGLL